MVAASVLGDVADIIMGQSPPGETCNEAGVGVPLLNGPTEYGPHNPTPVEFTTDPRKRAQLDWTLRENVRAQLRVLVKRILRKHGYPPDKQEKATQTVLEQAGLLSQQWISAA
jgi:restriction endonuclease HindI-like protein